MSQSSFSFWLIETEKSHKQRRKQASSSSHFVSCSNIPNQATDFHTGVDPNIGICQWGLPSGLLLRSTSFKPEVSGLILDSVPWQNPCCCRQQHLLHNNCSFFFCSLSAVQSYAITVNLGHIFKNLYYSPWMNVYNREKVWALLYGLCDRLTLNCWPTEEVLCKCSKAR